MRAPAWRDSGTSELIKQLEEEPSVLLQLIDVGVDTVQDLGLSDMTMSQEVVAPGGTVEIQAKVIANRSTSQTAKLVDESTNEMNRQALNS